MRLVVLTISSIMLVVLFRELTALFPMNYYSKVRGLSERFGIDPFLIMAVMKAESDFDEGAISPAGALGLMQVMPSTAGWIAPHLDPTDPEQNIEIGVTYLRYLMDRYDGDLEKALMAYNIGPGALDDGDRIECGKRYLNKVKIYWFVYRFMYRSLF